MNEDIAKKITKIRLENNMNQREFSSQMNISQGYLSKIEKGIIGLSEDFLLRLREVFKVDINWLLTGMGESYIKEKNEETSILAENSNVINIQGSSHKINEIHIGDIVEKKQQKIVHLSPPGSISPAQAQSLKEYVENIINLSTKANYYPAHTYGGVWKAFQKKFRIPTYHDLPENKYAEAVKYFQIIIGRINKKGFNSRNKSFFIKNYIKSIHAIYKTRLGWTETQYRNFLLDNYNVSSSLDLSDQQILSLYYKLNSLVKKKEG